MAQAFLLAGIALVTFLPIPWVGQTSCSSLAFHGAATGADLGSLTALELIDRGEAAPWLLLVWLGGSALLAFRYRGERGPDAFRRILVVAAAIGFLLFALACWKFGSDMCLFADAAWEIRAGLDVALFLGAAQTIASFYVAFAAPPKAH